MAQRMTAADRVYKYAAEAAKATELRNKAILAMAKEGETFRAIGEVAGLSHTAVQLICSNQGWESPHGRGRRPAKPVKATAKRTSKPRSGKGAAKAEAA